MFRRFALLSLLLILSLLAMAGSEDTKTRPNKEEIANLLRQTSRMSAAEQDSKISRVLKDQANSQTPRSDFMFCTSLAYLGNYKGQMCVGNAYENGLGIVEDMSEAYTWYELAVGSNIKNETDAKKAEADRDRAKEKLVSAYPHPTEDELIDLVNAQKTRIAQYQEDQKDQEVDNSSRRG
jgi:hypothetical protein